MGNWKNLEMSNILLSFIAGNDPGENNNGPLLSILDKLNEDFTIGKIVLFYKPGSFFLDGSHIDSKISEIKTVLEMRSYRENDETLKLVDFEDIDPSEEQSILPALISWIETSAHNEDNHFINVASGTPAMRSVFTFLADANLLKNANLWYSARPSQKDPNVERVWWSCLSRQPGAVF